MNDEDIKILENYIYNKKDTMKEQLVQAIENLLKENKELEKTITRKMNNNKKLARKYLSERYKNKQLELDEKEKEVVEAYRNIKKITGSDSWIVCNPETMWSEYFVPVAKIKEKIKEMEKVKDNLIDTSTEAIQEKNIEKFDLFNKSVNDISRQIEALQELLEGK